jgi:hypothetical protein
MRSLAQSKVLTKAGAAALITSLAACPRLAGWIERPDTVFILFLTLLWTTFILWAFVFGWHELYTGKPFLQFPVPSKLWWQATGFGLAGAAIFSIVIDPTMRAKTPLDYPDSLKSWFSMALFTLAFDPLFICFAPFAFFMRLLRNARASMILTVLFGVFVLYMKLSSSKELPPGWMVALWAVVRVSAGFVTVYLYIQGGALLVWWLVLLIKARHLIQLLGPG